MSIKALQGKFCICRYGGVDIMQNFENSANICEAIPYSSFNQKINIVSDELRKNRYVEVWGGYIISTKKENSR